MTTRRSGGFTLVEMLVAVSLLGLLGIISWRGLDHVIDQRARISQQDAQVARLVRAIAQIERDINERLSDALLVAPDGSSIALPGSMTIAADDESHQRVTILRRHPDRAGTVRTSYRLDQGQLVRLSVSREYAQPDRVLLLRDIAAFRTRLLSQSGWQDVRELQDARALAIEISIERDNGERYTKIMPL
ncbi:MAG TPA: prepilin-type N-terminal cleavage/methylation domain-containing protein [Burkholderiales bacterium]|nr:prepilin-type N-terminal cleavage/methylation domain-containing protein [Burkholderiales bacterium]